ncbi:putative voltage-gated chloride channel [Myxozyma melibiosi]|uniref:Chloride channel protein n=1 Tax=Myxozyma melibiosi TaxID=54550 RepID=A0ABR1FD44_9ASCO
MAAQQASISRRSLDELLATPTTSRGSSIDLDADGFRKTEAMPETKIEEPTPINPWSERPPLSQYSSESYTSRRITPSHENDDPYEDQANDELLAPPGRQRGNQDQFQSLSPSASFTPATRFSLESASTIKGLPEWNVSGNSIGYENMSTIDWMNEYRKERLRHNSAQKSYISDSAKIWFVLLVTGLWVGLITAGADVVVNWLADLKLGYCRSGFYLSHEFCCLGEDLTCDSWTAWGAALHASGSGSYVIDYIFHVLYALIFGSAAAFLVLHYAPYACHSGIPEIKTILGGFIIKGFMGFWTLVTKTCSMCLASASGLWFGAEEPLVHIACCCANITIRLFPSLRRNEARKREIFSAAAAAGIAVGFGAPVGGVLYSLEQISYYFPDKTLWQSFVCAMVASVSIQLANPFRTGKLVIFQVTSNRLFHDFEIVPFVLLGVIGGVVGALFIKLNMMIARWRPRSRVFNHPLVEVAVLSVVTALVNFPDPFSRIQNIVLVANLFQECAADSTSMLCDHDSSGKVIALLLLVAFLGIIFSAYTFGTSIPSGVMMPSMTVGACYGRAFGILMESWQRNHPDMIFFRSSRPPDGACVTPEVYAIVGAASALGGVTRLTVSLVVIMFELTGALGYVLPIMVSVLVAKLVGDAFDRNGIYESWIHFRGYPFLSNNDDDPVPDLSVDEVMTSVENLTVLEASGLTIGELEDVVATHDYKGFPVVDNAQENTLLGYIARNELKYALQQARTIPQIADLTPCLMVGSTPLGGSPFVDLRQLVNQTPPTLSYRSTLALVATMFQRMGLRYMLLTKKGKLQGLITRKRVCAIA